MPKLPRIVQAFITEGTESNTADSIASEVLAKVREEAGADGRSSIPLRAKELEEAAIKWRLEVSIRTLGHVFLSFLSFFAMSAFMAANLPADTGARGLDRMRAAANALDMDAVSTLTISSTALIASVLIAVVVSPGANSLSNPVDRIAASLWQVSASVTAFILSTITSGVVALSLLRTSDATGGLGWHLVPLAVAGSALSVVTTTRAENSAAVAAPERDFRRLARRVAVLRASGVPSRKSLNPKSQMRGEAGLLLAVTVSVTAYCVGRAIAAEFRPLDVVQYLLAAALALFFQIFLIFVSEEVKLFLYIRRQWRMAAASVLLGFLLATAAGGLVCYAVATHWFALVTVAVPVLYVVMYHLSLFVRLRPRPGFYLTGGFAPRGRFVLERRLAWSASRINQ